MQKELTTYKSLTKILISCSCAVLSVVAYSFCVNNMNNPLLLMILLFQIPKDQQGLYEGLLQSSVYLGCLFGSILGIYLVHLGSRTCFHTIDLFIIAGSSLLFIDNIYVFLIGRVILGIGCGLAPSITAYYIKQYCPQQIYGFIGGLNPMTYSVGLIITQVFGLFFQEIKGFTSPSQINDYWRYYFTVFPITICLVRIVLLQTVLTTDTPLYYVSVKDNEKAVEALQEVYKEEFVSSQLILNEQEIERQKVQKSLFKKPYKRRLYFGFFLQLLTANCGYNCITQFSTEIFTDMFGEKTGQVLTLMVAVIKLTFYAVCFTLSQKYGRRKLFIGGNLLMLFMNFTIGSLSLKLDTPDLDNTAKISIQYIIVICIYIYFIANFISLPPLVSMYIPEILPSRGVQYTWVLYWSCQLYILLLFPIIKSQIGLSFCFYYFGCFNIIGQIMIHFYLAETKGASEEQIEEFYYPKSHAQVWVKKRTISEKLLTEQQKQIQNSSYASEQIT